MINTRRKFIKQTSGILPLLLAPSFLSRRWSHSIKEIKIDEINLFLINVTKERNFSHGVAFLLGSAFW